MIDADYLRRTFGLEGRIALVTGAARGLGFAISEALAKAGAHVVINDMAEQAAEEAVESLRAQGLSADSAVFSVSDEAAADAGVKAIIEKHGRLDIVVSNAGNQNRKAFHEYERSEWDSLFDVHINGAFHVLRAALPAMQKNGFGRVVMMSSVASQASRGAISLYATVKGGLASMTRALAVEYGGSGITVNALAPGFMQTEFTSALQTNQEFQDYIKRDVPLGRWGKAEELGPAVVYLTSPAGNFVNGELLTIDGGLLAKF
jgi:gluconate 5-dehydrogenase